MGRLVALVAWGAAAGLYLYVAASARWRADARRHRCHLDPAPPRRERAFLMTAYWERKATR